MLTRKNKSLADDINIFTAVKSVIGLIIGILAESILGLGIATGIAGSIVFAAIMLYMYKSKTARHKHQINFLNGLSFYGLWISIGLIVTAYHKTEPLDIYEINGKIKYGIITSPLEEREKTLKTTLLLRDSAGNNIQEIMAYFEKDSTAQYPQYGDLIAFFSDTRYLKNSGNPLEFKYKEYMEKQGIYCSSYIKTNEYQILAPGYQKGIVYYGVKIRDYLIDIYRQTGISGQQLAVLEALTLGYKADLEPETVKAFQTSGAMHILAVSGLHTGIIMMITYFLLSSMEKRQITRILRSVIIIGILWLFAAVTGFSNSVCRSAMMFSLVALGQALNRKVSTYNTLAFSAIVLLMINPMLIYNVGFGLSYLAVLAIITIMPILEKLQPEINWVKNSRLKNLGINIWKYILGIMLVSIAAQIGTTILSIKTFNIFPVYFLLTNLVVIPLSYLVMLTAIATLALSFCGPLCQAATWILKIWLGRLTDSVTWIEHLPMSSIEGIFITNWMAIALYATTAMAVIWLCYRNFKYLRGALACLIAFAIIMIVSDKPKNIVNQVIIYNQRNYPLYSICNNGHMMIMTSGEKMDSISMAPALQNVKLSHYSHVEYIDLDSITSISKMYHEIGGKSIYILTDNRQIEIMDTCSLDIDIMVISNNTYIKAEEVKEKFNCAMVIFDSSCSGRFINTKSEEFYNQGIECYNTKEEGAYIIGDAQESIWWY